MNTHAMRFIPPMLLLILAMLAGCAEEESTPASNAQTVIAQARTAHGSNVLDSAVVAFDFRGKHFTARHGGRGFRYVRTYADSSEARVREVLTADTLYRTVAGNKQPLSSEERQSVETAVNSVVYFVLLPHALADPAVQPRYLGHDTLGGEPYHEIEVTFRKEGGGRDWQDRFIYWIHQEHHTMDYLAYYFHTDGGGSRFRKAVNPRSVRGVRFQDYLNYAVEPDTLGVGAVERYDTLFEADAVRKISTVRLDSVQVRPLAD